MSKEPVKVEKVYERKYKGTGVKGEIHIDSRDTIADDLAKLCGETTDPHTHNFIRRPQYRSFLWHVPSVTIGLIKVDTGFSSEEYTRRVEVTGLPYVPAGLVDLLDKKEFVEEIKSTSADSPST